MDVPTREHPSPADGANRATIREPSVADPTAP